MHDARHSANGASNRLHFDLEVDDLGAATEHIERLGGKRLPSDDFSEYGFHWRVMADPTRRVLSGHVPS